MHYSKERIKKKINSIGKKAVIRECRIGIINDSIAVTLELALGKAECLIIDGIEYKTINNTVRLPYDDKIMDALLSKGIVADLVLGKSKRKTVVSRALYKVEGEKLVIDDNQYEYDCGALISLSDFIIDDKGLSFRSLIAAGRDGELTFAVVDDTFGLLAESIWNPKNGSRVTLKGVQIPEDNNYLQLVAFRNKEAIPLVSGIGQKLDGIIISQAHNRICLEKDRDDAYSFESIGKIDTKEFISDSKNVRFSIDCEKDALFLTAKPKNADKLVLTWQDLRTGNDIEIAAFDVTNPYCFRLDLEMERHIMPYERYALRYKLINKRKIFESGFVSVDSSPKRLFSDNVIMSRNNNRIIRMVNGTLILECADSYLSYHDKYSYDFLSCGFRAQAHNVRFEEFSLCFDLKLQSTLLSISSAEVYVKDSYKKTARLIKEFMFDLPQVSKDIPVRIDLAELMESRYNNMRLSVCVGVRYTNGYAEDDFVCVSSKECAAYESCLCECSEDGTVTMACIEEDHHSLSLLYLSEEEFNKR